MSSDDEDSDFLPACANMQMHEQCLSGFIHVSSPVTVHTGEDRKSQEQTATHMCESTDTLFMLIMTSSSFVFSHININLFPKERSSSVCVCVMVSMLNI